MPSDRNHHDHHQHGDHDDHRHDHLVRHIIDLTRELNFSLQRAGTECGLNLKVTLVEANDEDYCLTGIYEQVRITQTIELA